MNVSKWIVSSLVTGLLGVAFLSPAAAQGPGKPGGPGGQGGRRPNPAQMFERMDKNKDGKLVQSEVPAKAWERISRADANKDGGITLEELRAARGKRGEGKRPGKGVV
jgi:hypothetical protein